MKHKALLLERKNFYNTYLTDVILKYWIDKTDKENGGFFTCYNVLGDRLESTDKYVWSQGRCVWMYSKLAGNENIIMDEELRRKCRENADMGVRYLQDVCILRSGECAFCVSDQGVPREVYPGLGVSVSSFADCFVVMGLAAYAELTGDEKLVLEAYELFAKLIEMRKADTFKIAPTILPKGWRAHAVPMILINTGMELTSVLEQMGMAELAAIVNRETLFNMADINDHFMSKSGIIRECLDENNEELSSIYGSYINPGHTNECAWFLIHAAEYFKDDAVMKNAKKTVLVTSRLAWDEQYGGMYYYSEPNGGKPTGRYVQEEENLAEGVLKDWSNKMWWSHTETIYSNLLCYLKTENEEYWELYNRYHDYTFQTFPNPNAEVGEWIQIRDRKGRPLFEDVGGRLPVKDPYHLTRDLLLLVELLGKTMI